ncbi:MAG: hypothetical protein LBE18_01180, partial [Planctomycetaceae bacterium]|nr:hypothetical protein [Planctomycetaceae bacterium]
MTKKRQQHTGFTVIQDSEQLQMYCLLKKLIRQKMPKIWRKLLATATLCTALSVNLGGGGGLGCLNKAYADQKNITTTEGVVDLGAGSGPYVNLYIDKGAQKYYYYNGSSSEAVYVPGTDTFKLTGNLATGSVNQLRVGGLFTNDNTLNFDFATHEITVKNTNTSGQFTAGFGYVSDTDFSGTLSVTDTSAATYSVTAAGGAAYGFVFSNTDYKNPANLSNATINLSGTSGTTIKVTNSGEGDVFGFVAGDLTGTTKITLDTIKAETSNTNGTANAIHGFIAGNVSADSSITLGNVTAGANDANAKNDVAIGVELKDIYGTVTTDNIVVTGNYDGNSTGASNNDFVTGFSAKSILTAGAKVELGTITATADNVDATGVHIGREAGTTPNPNTTGKITGAISVGAINVTTTGTNHSKATGFNLEVATPSTNSNNPDVTGTITLAAVNVTGDESAYGVQLGKLDGHTTNDPYYTEQYSVKAGSLVLNGDVKASATVTDTHANSYVIGVSAGQLGGLDVSHKISASTTIDKDNDDYNWNYGTYGIWTSGSTSSDASKANNLGSSTININNNAVITATIQNNATGSSGDNTGINYAINPDYVASIRMDSTDNDVVNIDTTSWTNDNQAFTLIGVETLNVTGVADLSGTDSLRGRATAANGVAVTNVTDSGSLKVKDTFFNKGT